MEYHGVKDPRLHHDTYLKTDVLLLADVFQTFRDACVKNCKLDPAHFCTSPGLAWQALLNTAAEYCEHKKRHKDCELCPDEFRLELLTDINMLKVFEVGLTRQLNVMPGPIINIRKTYTILMKRAYILSMWMQITFTDG